MRERDRREGVVEKRGTRAGETENHQQGPARRIDEVAQAGDSRAAAGEEHDPQVAAEGVEGDEGSGRQSTDPAHRHERDPDADPHRAGDQQRTGAEHHVVAQSRRPAAAPGEVERRRDRHQRADVGDPDGARREHDREQPVIMRVEFAHEQDVQDEVEQALDQLAGEDHGEFSRQGRPERAAQPGAQGAARIRRAEDLTGARTRSRHAGAGGLCSGVAEMRVRSGTSAR
ncbi:hypothetical protein ACU4GR_24455 [Methylobacterium oryzae CBMB20]